MLELLSAGIIVRQINMTVEPCQLPIFGTQYLININYNAIFLIPRDVVISDVPETANTRMQSLLRHVG